MSPDRLATWPGAGLDTLAWRHTDLEPEVVEIDQPDSIADKLQRVRAAGLAPETVGGSSHAT